jgi:tripartite-type tricarboxylate transporter receptor subunit TctC
VRRLNAEVVRIMGSSEVQTRLMTEGARFAPTTPDGFGDFVKAEIASWAPIVKASGARAD